MPWGDGTGPSGYGPMTGRAAGFCSGYQMPGYKNPMPRRGLWRRAYSGAQMPVDPRWMNSYGSPGFYGGFGRPFGRRFGFGRGFGRGRGRFAYGW
jgi:hypothetical protein